MVGLPSRASQFGPVVFRVQRQEETENARLFADQFANHQAATKDVMTAWRRGRSLCPGMLPRELFRMISGIDEIAKPIRVLDFMSRGVNPKTVPVG
jgi:hypothetical protein